jgi:hypothetical protein
MPHSDLDLDNPSQHLLEPATANIPMKQKMLLWFLYTLTANAPALISFALLTLVNNGAKKMHARTFPFAMPLNVTTLANFGIQEACAMLLDISKQCDASEHSKPYTPSSLLFIIFSYYKLHCPQSKRPEGFTANSSDHKTFLFYVLGTTAALLTLPEEISFTAIGFCCLVGSLSAISQEMLKRCAQRLVVEHCCSPRA